MTTPSALRRAAFAALLAAALTACSDEPQPTPPAAPPPEVTVVTLEAQTVTLTRELPGRINPYLVAEVRPQVSGIIKARLFTEGSMVKAGQPLYQLDDALLRADQANARAVLLRAQATLESARLTARRSTELARIDAVSKQDDENAIAALRQAEADVAASRAAVERGAVTLGYARIVSPISGRIGKSAVTQGALVTANQAAALATVQQLNPIYVDVTQSSAELLDLKRQVAAGTLEAARDLPVSILLEDGSRYPHDGKLTFADVTVDPGTGSYLLRVVVPNPQGVLLPGMYVRAVVGSGVRQDALLVPQQGVARDAKGSTSALVLAPGGKVEQRNVRVSRAIGGRWLVEEGLAPGDQVIVEGLQKVKPGVTARSVEPGAPDAKPGKPAPDSSEPPQPAAQPKG